MTSESSARCCALSLAALAFSLAAAGDAEASCGDYVLVRDAYGRLVSAAELSGMDPAVAAKHSSAPAKLPCRGPKCSQAPSSPPAAPPMPLRWLSPPDGLLVQLAAANEWFGSDRRHSSAAPVHPIHHPGRVFRPPRS